MEKQTFNKGDFLKYTSYSATGADVFRFGIFEGIDLEPSYQYTKKYSLAVFYDGRKYCQEKDGSGWDYRAVLEVTKNGKYCEKTIDTLCEDTWWAICTPEEKERAIRILALYGYEWNEELMSLIDTNTGEVVHKIIVPKLEYKGDTIKPIREDLKNKLKHSVISKNTYTASPYYHNRYGEYDEYMD